MRALDLFCGAGGVSAGLARAGFEVTGVDIAKQPRYPFPFIRADAMEIDFQGFDLIWVSPPCQGYTSMRHAPGAVGAPRLIGEVRARLQKTSALWCIENVEEAMFAMRKPVTLCGSMFGLGAQGCRLQRHRLFEANFAIPKLFCHHDDRPVIGIYGGHARRTGARVASVNGHKGATGPFSTTGEFREFRELISAIPIKLSVCHFYRFSLNQLT